jgi:uncharacterized repeat protein (TIGR03803 family)
MTTSKAPQESLISKIRRRAAGGILLLSILLILPLIAIPSAHAQTFTVLHEFAGGLDGAWPIAVIRGANGNTYGVTQLGGSFDYGTVFEMNGAGKKTLLHTFLGSDGLYPAGGLMQDSAGNLYGTTADGGAAEGGGCEHGCGTIFKIDTTGKQTVLYAFTGKTDGSGPDAVLIRDPADNLYGTTGYGGSPSCFVGLGCGVIFKLDQTDKETVLYTFTDKTDGQNPAGVVRDGLGNLYGVTYSGGTSSNGAVFNLDKTGKLTILYSFTGGSDSGDPKGPVTMDKSGNIYGTTYGVFQGGFGNVYKFDTAGNFTVLYAFNGTTDGQYPGNLVLDAAGNLYGIALGGGTGTGCYYGGCGTIFKIDTGGSFSVVHSFTGTDGQLPNSLIIDQAGNLYGTTMGGGKGSGRSCSYYKGCGTVFEFTP